MTLDTLRRAASVILPAKQKEKEKGEKANLLSHTFQVVDNPIH